MTADTMISLRQLQTRLLTSVVLGIVILLVLSLVSDLRAVAANFSSFRWGYLPLILLLTALNYVLRWLKWEYYLRRLDMGQGVSRGDSGLIFTAGMVMSVTPGKVGEVFKSYLLKRVNGTLISASAPIVLVERLTDGLAMLLLMALGLTLYPPARPAFVLLVAVTLAGILLVQNRRLCERLLSWYATSSLPLRDKAAPKLITLYTSTYRLANWRILLISTLISFLSWGFECIAFYYVLLGLGVDGSPLLLQQATFIFAASTLLGLVSFLPGGLGASEISSAGLLVALVGVSGSVAATATIIIRFATLWFGVGLGVVALLWFRQRYPSGEPGDLLETAR
jgi:uncharacterized protein (TIRG00374 family)